jgi:putative membrane-bound dehydrogenase-like protein
MTVAEGLEVILFAAEPMVRNPASMDVDHQGRVWLTEGVNYRVWQKWGKQQPAGDRIVILEDTDRDGVADKQTTFYQGNEINTALGICVLGEKVYVSSSPNIYVFTDANGDGKADGKPEVLFSGIGGTDNDHGVHALVFGPDGRLYFNFGNAGGQIKGPNGSPLSDLDGQVVAAQGKPYRQGMAFRCDLDGGDFETLAWNFRNPYEVAVDSFGTVWQSDNDDDGNQGVRINYVMEFGNHGYTDELTGAGWMDGWKRAAAQGVPAAQKVFYEWHQHDPGVVPNLLHTGAGSPCGLCVYEGRLLPEPYHGQLIHCDAGPRVVRAYRVEADGAGYKASIHPLLASADDWFRPVDVCVAPDGSLLVADWNDAGVGGHYMADQSLETMTGRVYRVAPKGHRPAVPALDLHSAAGCVSALQSPNQATRYLAWRELLRTSHQAEEHLIKLWHGQDARLRARALQVLAKRPGLTQKLVHEAAKDPDPDIRVAAVRIARAARSEPVPLVIPVVQLLAKDPSPQVRRECAIALRHSPSPAVPGLWAALAAQHDGRDRWYLEALGIGADRQWDACFEAWLAQVGDPSRTPAGRDIVWRSRSKKTPALLARIIADSTTPGAERDRYFRALDFIAGPEKDAALVELLTKAAK